MSMFGSLSLSLCDSVYPYAACFTIRVIFVISNHNTGTTCNFTTCNKVKVYLFSGHDPRRSVGGTRLYVAINEMSVA